jgi:hypothetical protein
VAHVRETWTKHPRFPISVCKSRVRIFQCKRTALAGIDREVKAALDEEEPLLEQDRPEKAEDVLNNPDPVRINSEYGNSESYLRRRLARDGKRNAVTQRPHYGASKVLVVP